MNIVLLIVSLLPFISLADAPENWQIGFQDPATPIMQGIIDLHHDIFFFMLVILLFVIWMLARTFYHFHQSRNPVPEKMLHTSTFFLIIGPFFIWLLITVIPFQSFGMDIESTLSLENVSNSSVTSPAESQDLEEIIPNPELQTGIVAQNQELAVVNDGADSELLTVIDNIDAQNQDLTLVGGNPAFNSEAYVSTSRGNIDALRYSQGCDILGKQSLEAGVTAERSGNIKAATLHFIASKHYAELADSGIRIHQASELAPQFADRARVIHDQLLDIQSVEYSKAAEIDSDNAAAQNRSLSVITSLKTQASDVGVKLKTAVNRTVSSPRVRTAFTMAQAPLIALGAICAKSGADHLFDAFRHR